MLLAILVMVYKFQVQELSAVFHAEMSLVLFHAMLLQMELSLLSLDAIDTMGISLLVMEHAKRLQVL